MQLLPEKLAFDTNHIYLNPPSVDVRLSKGDVDPFPKRHLTSASIRQALHCLRFEPDFADHRSILVVAPRKTMAFQEKVTTHVQR